MWPIYCAGSDLRWLVSILSPLAPSWESLFGRMPSDPLKEFHSQIFNPKKWPSNICSQISLFGLMQSDPLKEFYSKKKWPSKFALKYLKYLYSIGHNLILYSQKKLIQKSDLQKLAYVSNIDSGVCLFLLPADPLKEFNSQIVDLNKISFCHLIPWKSLTLK